MRKSLGVLLVAVLLLGIIGCASNQAKGTVIGAAAGGVVGGLIGKKAGNTALGAIIGAAVGGAAGNYIGNYMDNQAEEMKQDIAGAKIERVGEGIKITFDSGLLFDTGKAALKTASRENLSNLARILNKYKDTNILLEGHTDSDGSEEYNLQLSRSRANAVANYLESLQVDPTRFTIMGYGEQQPIASNETMEGKAQNRRVEVAIFANDKLKKIAEKEAG
ncbi:OmpA family protein [candidate division WOR-3 bacterium]|nr:OmpA family protein [candidate division WOR-3 bacterium]